MERSINDRGLQKLKQWEGLRLEAYADIAGVLTIGYGHTSSAGAPSVHKGLVITEAQADDILRDDLKKHEARVVRLVTVPLTDNQFAALVSFDFNTGALHKSTLLKKLNAGNYNAVPTELLRWVKTTDPHTKKKVTSKGLVNRRSAEAGLWAKGEEVASNTSTAEPRPAPVITKENLTFGAGLLASLAALFDGTGPVQYALGAVIAISFIAGLGVILHKQFRPS